MALDLRALSGYIKLVLVQIEHLVGICCELPHVSQV